MNALVRFPQLDVGVEHDPRARNAGLVHLKFHFQWAIRLTSRELALSNLGFAWTTTVDLRYRPTRFRFVYRGGGIMTRLETPTL